VLYKFAIGSEASDTAHTSVVFQPPNEFVITTDRLPPFVDSYPVTRRSWFRRLFHARSRDLIY
jgi:hypothetical protein